MLARKSLLLGLGLGRVYRNKRVGEYRSVVVRKIACPGRPASHLRTSVFPHSCPYGLPRRGLLGNWASEFKRSRNPGFRCTEFQEGASIRKRPGSNPGPRLGVGYCCSALLIAPRPEARHSHIDNLGLTPAPSLYFCVRLSADLLLRPGRSEAGSLLLLVDTPFSG